MIARSVSAAETRALGARAAASARPGDVFALEGDLGAGKTEFVRGFVAALSKEAAVRSPSFSILNIYETPAFPVCHFDFYRLADASELVETGFPDYAGSEAVCLVEWGTLFPGVLPPNTRIIRFRDRGNQTREIEWDGTPVPAGDAGR
ncbi:MAG: tRNA (adenosine(37)-N6)-threonylcarbamoyltransferase complex ATPase subunit type 1 TsaE [Chitinispirillaceae bacterium]|nr:tRNA (adenosine(37)-N6)-threonylcarbamoyltransferase complex ATPase subunit type 1 TsaE [Chitinispirillaceae bacterium]